MSSLMSGLCFTLALLLVRTYRRSDIKILIQATNQVLDIAVNF